MLVIGVDTGSQGAFVALGKSGKIVHKATFSEGPNGIDFNAYVSGLRELKEPETKAYVEEVHAIFGSSARATFTFGRNFQLALDGLSAAGIPYEFVKPKEWQKIYFEKLPHIYKKNSDKVDTKAMARLVALKHFPEKSLLKSERSSKPHEGLVDAALIARYGLLKMKQGEL